MRFRLSAILAATAVADGALVASALPAGANAATRTPIRTFHEAFSFNLVGTGPIAGWYRHFSGVQLMVFSPHLEFYSSYRDKGFDSKGRPYKANGVEYIVGGSLYSRVNGGRWSVQKQSPKQLQADIYGSNPAVGLARFQAIPGVTLVGRHHYQVTASRAHANAFLSYEYGLTSSDLAAGRITALTMSAWTDGNGHVTRFVITAKSAEESVNIVETFTAYNQPLTITAPHTR
jgi:hypothetical protein